MALRNRYEPDYREFPARFGVVGAEEGDLGGFGRNRPDLGRFQGDHEAVAGRGTIGAVHGTRVQILDNNIIAGLRRDDSSQPC